MTEAPRLIEKLECETTITWRIGPDRDRFEVIWDRTSGALTYRDVHDGGEKIWSADRQAFSDAEDERLAERAAILFLEENSPVRPTGLWKVREWNLLQQLRAARGSVVRLRVIREGEETQVEGHLDEVGNYFGYRFIRLYREEPLPDVNGTEPCLEVDFSDVVELIDQRASERGHKLAAKWRAVLNDL